MRYKMTYILFLFFLLTTIPYIITIYINKKTRKIFRLKTMTVDIKYKTRAKILIWKVTF